MAENPTGSMNRYSISKFEKSMSNLASHKSEAILKSAKDFHRQEMEKAQESIKNEVDIYLQKEEIRVISAIAREYAQKEQELKKELLLRRRYMQEEVFESAKNELLNFSKSEDYKAFLQNCAQKAADIFNCEDTVFCIREEDFEYCGLLKDTFKKPCTFEKDGLIHIGGVKIKSSSFSLAVDMSIDMILESKKEWFKMNANLTIV